MTTQPTPKTDAQLLAELRTLALDLEYDVSRLPFKIMRDEAGGRSLFKSYETLANWMNANPAVAA